MPPNCRFELDDAKLEWTYAADRFDFVHLRCLFGSIKDWPALYREVYKFVTISPAPSLLGGSVVVMVRSYDLFLSKMIIFYYWGVRP